MKKIISFGNEEFDVLVFDKIVSYSRELVGKIWLTPTEMQDSLKDIFKTLTDKTCDKVIVSGETENTTIYILLDKDALVISPSSDLRKNVLLNRWRLNWFNDIVEPINYKVLRMDDKLRFELQLPKVVLVNLCVIENYPIPRLNLSTGSISAFLRKEQLADVTILDMQLGYTIEQVVEEYKNIQPALIGVSINFGQKQLAFDLLDRLYECNNVHNLSSEIVVGNLIPAFSPNEFFSRYPEILISYREGEYSWCDLARYTKDLIRKSEIDGLMFLEDREIIKTVAKDVDMTQVPTPSLDTLRDIARLKGALTIETTRGCDYAKCTFCPRDHKLNSWRFLSEEQTLKQLKDIINAGKKFGIKSHIYLADEEFVGEMPNGKEADRIIAICKGIYSEFPEFKYDSSARADSVFDRKKSIEWNIKRIEMWYHCKKSGLDRLFVGVESGCDRQLKRYGKGTTSEQNIVALRILTALGINIRIGFVMFDHLMESLDDIEENINFLERTDVIMQPIALDKMSFEDLFHKVTEDKDFIAKHSSGKPIYSVVSYMLASLEVLMGTPYIKIIKNLEKTTKKSFILNDGKPDSNMGRYSVKFIENKIGAISDASQKWIDSNFPIMYTVKSLHKVASIKEKKLLYSYMVTHREISHFYLRYVVNLFKGSTSLSEDLKQFLKKTDSVSSFSSHLIEVNKISGIEERLKSCLTKWQKLMELLIDEISDSLETGKLTDTYDERLRISIDTWKSNMGIWELINEQFEEK
jgi:hypothetical protein